ncbi:MAG: sugar ABC transporter ATP-binding protein [Armatimonadetes bacterium]|nr:sugar ABC transporter ATP-binding protein [Armatimonadota bacterium]
MRGICKRFGGVQALRNVSFDVAPGTCHALMGENGAGKSTLGKIIAGIHHADEGEILVDGRAVSIKSPMHAAALGIAMVHQELLFCENLSVAENMSLEQIPRKGLWVDRQAMRDRAAEWLAPFAQINPDSLVGSLSIGQQQLVQIAGAVGRGAKTIIFDEPTSSLTQAETEKLFLVIRDLLSQGVTCIYVSHRMKEVFSICSHVSVLRDGEHVHTGPLNELDDASLVRLMIGRDVDQSAEPPAFDSTANPMVEVRDLHSDNLFEPISFSIRAGEILGFAGLVGAGRSEIARALAGLDTHARGQVRIGDRLLRLGSAPGSIRAGVGHVPEDRKSQGLAFNLNVRENSTLASLGEFASFGFVNKKSEREAAESARASLRIKCPTVEVPVDSLSGGNQQKVVLSKWLVSDSKLLILDEPTRGVDVGSKSEIHALIRELASQGKAILLISSELPELLAVSHRILVLRNGKLAGEIAREHATEESVVAMMTGIANV